jgi:hypothetical protein
VTVFSGTNRITCGPPPTTPPAGNRNPFGRLEVAQNRADGMIHVSGWAIDPDTTGPVPIAFYIGSPSEGVLAGTTVANRNRPEIGALYPAFGPNHGFEAGGAEIGPPPPEDWPYAPLPGEYDICAWAQNVGPGTANVMLGCGRVQVAHW